MGVVTIEMKTSFMQPCARPAHRQGPADAPHRHAWPSPKRTIYDEAGRACAHATGTFKYVPRLPIGPKSAQRLNVISTD